MPLPAARYPLSRALSCRPGLFFRRFGYNARPFTGPFSDGPNPESVQRAEKMVKIRLSRVGAKGRPFYHIVVTDERNKRDGRSIERLGFYNPIASGKDVELSFDTARADHWVGKGAQMTAKVKFLHKRAAKAAPKAAT